MLATISIWSITTGKLLGINHSFSFLLKVLYIFIVVARRRPVSLRALWSVSEAGSHIQTLTPPFQRQRARLFRHAKAYVTSTCLPVRAYAFL